MNVGAVVASRKEIMTPRIRPSAKTGYGHDESMMRPSYRPGTTTPNPEDDLITIIERLRSLARELAGEAWDYDRRQLPAQAHVRREAAKEVMNRADAIQREDAMFNDPT